MRHALPWPALLLAGFLASVLPAASVADQPAGFKPLFEAESFTLGNGMEVVVLPKHLAPVVFQAVVYKAGAADGEPGRNGIAHFLEHLMFKATKKMKSGQFTAEVDRVGGTDNAFTDQDMTVFHQEFASEHLAKFMAMEADRMENLQLDDSVVLPERGVILNERGETVETSPGSRLAEAVDAALYQNHPYGLPVIGWRQEMEKYTTEDALRFYRRWYAPNNAILVVAGDVTPSEVKKLATATFGTLGAHTLPARERLMEPPPVAARRLSLASPEVETPHLWRRYLTDSYRSALAKGDPAGPYALGLLAEIMGGGAVGRLHRHLVIEQGIALGAGAGFSGDARDYGTFSFSVSPRDPDKLAETEAALDGEIASLLKDGITATELADAKHRLQMEAVKARDSLEGPALMVGEGLANGETLADILAWPAHVDSVTVDDVMRAARAVLVAANSVTATLLPEAPESGGSAP